MQTLRPRMGRPQQDAAKGVRPVQVVPVEPTQEGVQVTTTIIDKALRRVADDKEVHRLDRDRPAGLPLEG